MTLDPLNVAQWKFYVLSAAVLNTEIPTQKTASLSLGARQVPFQEIAEAIEETL